MRAYLAVLAAAGLMAPAVLAQRTTPAPKARTVSRTVVIGSRSFLGVGIADINAERAKALSLKDEHGVEITHLEQDSPAAKGGVKVGDVVLEYNGQRVEGMDQFQRFVRETPVGRQVKLGVWRNNAAQTLTATIGQREGTRLVSEPFEIEIPRIPEIRIPDMPRVFTSWRSPVLGIESESLGSQLADFFGVKDGVLVRSVTKGGAAEKAGIKAGDVIVKADDRHVSGPRDLSSAMRNVSKKTFPLTIVRDRKEMTITVTLEESPEQGALQERRRTEYRVERIEL